MMLKFYYSNENRFFGGDISNYPLNSSNVSRYAEIYQIKAAQDTFLSTSDYWGLYVKNGGNSSKNNIGVKISGGSFLSLILEPLEDVVEDMIMGNYSTDTPFYVINRIVMEKFDMHLVEYIQTRIGEKGSKALTDRIYFETHTGFGNDPLAERYRGSTPESDDLAIKRWIAYNYILEANKSSSLFGNIVGQIHVGSSKVLSVFSSPSFDVETLPYTSSFFGEQKIRPLVAGDYQGIYFKITPAFSRNTMFDMDFLVVELTDSDGLANNDILVLEVYSNVFGFMESAEEITKFFYTKFGPYMGRYEDVADV